MRKRPAGRLMVAVQVAASTRMATNIRSPDEGATENAAVVQALVDNLIARRLDCGSD
jgi:hypothetical protein